MTQNDHAMNIVLTGFMGTGKSTVGRIVANRLNRAFVDVDAIIEERAGKRISTIFAEDGEHTFREIEAEVCQDVSEHGNQVIATGGGAVLNTTTAQALANTGILICLTADIETIMARVGDDPERPLFTSHEEVLKLMSERAQTYAMLPNHIDTTERTPEDVADKVIHLWQLIESK